ncbi:outer membrane beta-barrel protein [Chitinophaga barathri]|uniref:TonB-dependent receptor n=1 Tax=Chitinophaga barathri TaxID=1647451 RepID=A0A3N4M7T4_9BACT|nr:outer membrane beta-barrel protein [Chitinophaga barathri]RPD39368.1 TonB-dependent receptor [Chitinophaga barathri]
MKQLILYMILTLVTILQAAAQTPGRPANIGHVYGKITDAQGKPLGDASVYLLQQKFDTAARKLREVLVKGATTGSNGEFSLAELPLMGKFKLKISAVGYSAYEQEIVFINMPAGARPGAVGAPGAGNAYGSTQGKPGPAGPPGANNADHNARGKPAAAGNNTPGNPPAGAYANTPARPAMGGAPGRMPDMSAFDKDLGNIKLSPVEKQLQTVTVTAARPLMQMDIDKKTFNVEKNLVSAGGTAVDVMRNVPSVQVDIDGNVKLRNAAPQLYIDGRPTTLSLDQIPAAEISSVEVITNPSAKYDASADAGILNIVLKKNRQTGYNGNIMAGADSRGGYNGGGIFNLRQGKFNLSATLMTNQVKNRTTGHTSRYLTDEPRVNIFQQNENKTTGGFLFGKLGLDYFASNRTTISLSAIQMHGNFKPGETIHIQTDSLLPSGSVSALGSRLYTSEREINGTTLQLGMKHNFPKPGREWTADFTWSTRKVSGEGLITSETDGHSGAMQQKNILGADNTLLIVQTDYISPLSPALKLETGLRAQYADVTNDNANFIRYPGGEFDPVNAASVNYATTNYVYAGYITLSGAVKQAFTYKAGLRAESSGYTGKLTNTGEKFDNDYPLSLFPSLALSRKLKKDQELQLSLTRRVNRPSFFQLSPYTDFTDNLNITRGNPDLVPEFTQSAEFAYSKTFKGSNTFLASAYYKRTSHLITRFLTKGTNPFTGEEAYINTFINANHADIYGMEFTSVNAPARWWDLTTNVNVYRSAITAEGAADPLWSVFAKVNNNFRLPRNFTVQLSADFQGKTNLPVNTNQGFGPPNQAQSASQGYIRPFYGVDLAVKKTFGKDNAASLTLGVNDIFRSRKTDMYSEGPGFTQDYYRLNNPQVLKLNFAYRFGKMDMTLFKRKNMKNQGVENLQDM